MEGGLRACVFYFFRRSDHSFASRLRVFVSFHVRPYCLYKVATGVGRCVLNNAITIQPNHTTHVLVSICGFLYRVDVKDGTSRHPLTLTMGDGPFKRYVDRSHWGVLKGPTGRLGRTTTFLFFATMVRVYRVEGGRHVFVFPFRHVFRCIRDHLPLFRARTMPNKVVNSAIGGSSGVFLT